MAKRKRDSAMGSALTSNAGTESRQEPLSTIFYVRSIFQHRASTQVYTVPAVDVPTLQQFLEKIHTGIPATAAATLFGKPVARIVLLLQETGTTKKMRPRRFTTICGIDGREFRSWYERNVTNSPKIGRKSLMVEMHILLDVNEASAEEDAQWYVATKEAGNGGVVEASLTKPYRQITRPKLTMMGPRPFNDIPLFQISELDIIECMLAGEFRPMPSTEIWMPKRAQDRHAKSRKNTERANKRLRPDDRKDAVPADGGDGASQDEDNFEEEEAETEEEKAETSEVGDIGVEEEHEKDDVDDDAGFSKLEDDIGNALAEAAMETGIEEEHDNDVLDDRAGFSKLDDIGNALVEAAMETGDGAQSQQALHNPLANWKEEVSMRPKAAE
jgi:hypothetical protein